MIIKNLTLQNIRSYRNGRIDLPSGTILLTGDIGSGKTTLLLAMEFALLGPRRGGPSILRHGEDSGGVELSFSVDRREVYLKRIVKRTKSGISSEECWIGLDGNEPKKTSTTELKQAVLELLGYPFELLSKPNPLIYRYTVYTPQEEMKEILLTDAEKRLETIRKIFNIDRYKLVKNNTKILSSFFKNRRKELEGRVYDLPEKKTQLREASTQNIALKKERLLLEPSVTLFQHQLKEAIMRRELAEKEILELREYKNRLDILGVKQENLARSIHLATKEAELAASDAKLLRGYISKNQLADPLPEIKIL